MFWLYAAMGLFKFVLSVALSAKCEVGYEETASVVAVTDDEERPLLTQGDDHFDVTSETYRTITDGGLNDVNRPAASGDSTIAGVSLEPQTSNTSCASSGLTSSASRTRDSQCSRIPPSIFKSTMFPMISRPSQLLLLQLCLLFAIDQFGLGLMPETWLTVYLTRRFSATSAVLGTTFFAGRILSSLTNLIAIPLTRIFGNIYTIVLSNAPASILLGIVPIAHSLPGALTLYLFRCFFIEFDQAPRQAFLAAAFEPSERTAVLGVVNIVRTGAQSLGPLATGTLSSKGLLVVSFWLMMGVKLVYDLLFVLRFQGYETREDKEAKQKGPATDEETDADGRRQPA